MAADAAHWLVRHERYARTVTIKVRYHDFTTITRSHSEDATRDEHERQVTKYRRHCGHEYRPQTCGRGLADGFVLLRALALQRVRELHDLDSILRDQSHQRDQPHLRVDVDRREIHEAENQRAGNRERHRAEQYDQRIAEALELRSQHQVDQDDRKQQRDHGARAFVLS